MDLLLSHLLAVLVGATIVNAMVGRRLGLPYRDLAFSGSACAAVALYFAVRAT